LIFCRLSVRGKDLATQLDNVYYHFACSALFTASLKGTLRFWLYIVFLP